MKVHILWRPMRLFLAVLTALSAHMAHAALTPGEIADFSNGLALDTFALKDLINGIVANRNPGALQDVFEQYNDIIDTLAAQFQYLPGTAQIPDAASQQAVFEAYSNFVQGLLELGDAIITGAGTLVSLDPRNYYKFPASESELQNVFDAYAYNIIALYSDDNDIHQQMVVQKAQVDNKVLNANAAIHSTNGGVPPPGSSTPPPPPPAGNGTVTPPPGSPGKPGGAAGGPNTRPPWTATAGPGGQPTPPPVASPPAHPHGSAHRK